MKSNFILSAKSQIVVIVALLGLVFSSCEKVTGEGPVIVQDRTVGNFKSVNAGVSGRINYTVSPVYKLELHAQQNILDLLETFVAGGELIIKFKNGVNVRSHEEIIVNISGPSPEGIALSGSGSLDLSGEVSGDGLTLRVSGSGNMRLDAVSLTNKLEATVSGSGNIIVEGGSAKMENAKISGSGNIQTAGVAVQNADTDISGSGNIKVKVGQKLNARISGSGSVYYAGTPLISTHISGSGSVRPL